ncbi:hypothetical protein ACJVC5_14460 [Peredibacter sp. HCB2-198]|uniref:hypothetical protein n=1 Tax=Peredibacter sp. HCB2-198 TaxID=3383025 RepID=UPI0038B48012
MAQDQTKKEALFNEVKGSLFEYLVAKEIARLGNEELQFQQTLDRNYLHVLSQQDRMVRQFYPEMLPFLNQVSKNTVTRMVEYLGKLPKNPKVMGKFSNSAIHDEIHEADLLVNIEEVLLPVSLKLNKKHAYVNTKSGGIKSFFLQYFPFLETSIQERFNQLVDLEFGRMAVELHALHDLDYLGNFGLWVQKGFSELPGELDQDSRNILKAYYARIAQEMHSILSNAQKQNPEGFAASLAPLMGFGKSEILQVICFHEFPSGESPEIDLHTYSDLQKYLSEAKIGEFNSIASVELDIGPWSLHIRVKPMNKFTTTAIKINCSIKVRK